MGTLYLVATPIGNLEDVTLRALRILSETPLIAAEDTRVIRKLLARYEIRGARLLSYTERNRRTRTPAILTALSAGDVALVSDAGMPAVSDPGVHLVEAAVAAGYTIVPVPGASALTAAIASAGLPARRFHYLGFLPRRAPQRRRLLREIADFPDTLIAFEAPHRLRAALQDLLDALGDRRIVICRELTKVHEEIFRDTISAALDHFARPRGELTLVIEGGDAKPKREEPSAIESQLLELRAQGLRARDAVRAVAQRSGVAHREVYRRWLALPDDAKRRPTTS